MTARYVSADCDSAGRQRHHVFFAFKPGLAVQRPIALLTDAMMKRYRLRGSRMAADRLHVTLCRIDNFLGDPPTETISKVRKIAVDVANATRPFKIQLNHSKSFRTGVREFPLVLRGEDGVVGIERFQRILYRELWARRLCDKLKRPFDPHLTIVYGGDREIDEQDIQPITWTAAELVLIDSLYGRGEHRILGRWPLNG